MSTTDHFLVDWPEGRPQITLNRPWPQAHREGCSLIMQGRVLRLSTGEAPIGDRSAADICAAVLDRWLARGEAGLRALVGDFALVITTPKEVLAYKTLTSPFQIFHDAHRLSNRLLPVAAPRGQGDLDPDYLMRLLMVTPGIQHALPCTPFRGVRRLRPWHLLRIEDGRASERQIERRDYRYGPPGQRMEAVAPEVRRVLTDCVEDRLRWPEPRTVCCEISGGLDSSFVASLVGQAREGTRGYMFSYPHKPSHRLGEASARKVAERHGIDLSIVGPDDVPAGDLSAPPSPRDEPTDFFWYGPKFGSYTAGSLPDGSLVFTGYAGDALFMRSPLILPRLLKQRKLRTFAKELSRFGALAQRSTVAIAAQSAMSLIPRQAYLRMATPFSGRRWNPFSVSDITADWALREPVDWLRRDPRALIEQQDRFDAEGHAADEALIGSTIVRDDSISYLAHRRVVISPWLDPAGIEEQSPFCDVRLFDLVYGEVDWALIHGFDGPYKQLLREAQRGLVPEIVRARKEDVFVFDSFRASVIDKNANLLTGLLGESDLLDDRIFDMDALQRTFQQLRFGRHSASIRSLYVLIGYLLWWADAKEGLERAGQARSHPSIG